MTRFVLLAKGGRAGNGGVALLSLAVVKVLPVLSKAAIADARIAVKCLGFAVQNFLITSIVVQLVVRIASGTVT